MKTPHKTAFILAAVLGLLASLPGKAQAAIQITDWVMTNNSLTFKFTGFIDPGEAAGPVFPNVFYIGDGSAFNTSWMLANTGGSFQSLPGDENLVSSTYAVSDNTNGDWVSVRINENSTPIITSADFFNISVTINATGAFNPSAIAAQNVKVALGFDYGAEPFFPDADYIVGGYAVPEPSTTMLLAGSLTLVWVTSRKRQHKAA